MGNGFILLIEEFLNAGRDRCCTTRSAHCPKGENPCGDMAYSVIRQGRTRVQLQESLAFVADTHTQRVAMPTMSCKLP